MVRLSKSISLTLCALAATVALGPAAHAAVLYSQAPLDGGDAFDGAYSTVQAFGFQNAESYSLGGPFSVTGFRWWGTEVNDLSLFVVRHFDDLVSAPDTFDLLAGTVVATSTTLTDSASLPIFQFDLTLASALNLGGSAYLSVFLDSDTAQWFWLESAAAIGDGVSAVRAADPGAWDIFPPDLSLEVIGEGLQTVPEPGSLALLGIAALAGFASRRRLAV